MNHRELANRLLATVGSDWLPHELGRFLDGAIKRVGIACSGGADSVFLLHWFWAFAQEALPQLELTVLHFNHHVRDEESDGDEAYVKEVCSGLDVEFISEKWIREPSIRATEDAMRGVRLAFFQKYSEELGLGCVLTGHHASDVAETFFMRLARGSGSGGLSAPRPVSRHGAGVIFARPLLELSSAFIRSSLEENGIAWREDASNASGEYFRNRVRKTVIPAWQEATDRDALAGATRSRRLLEEDDVALEAWLDREWTQLKKSDGVLDLPALAALPCAVQRRAIWRLALEAGFERSAQAVHVDSALEAIEACSDLVLDLIDDARLSIDWSKGSLILDTQSLRAQWDAFCLPVGCKAYVPRYGWLEAQEVQLDEAMRDEVLLGKVAHDEAVYLNLTAKQAAVLSVRSCKEGGSYAPHGLNSQKKVNRLLMDRKISWMERRVWPLFSTMEGEILWAPGLPPNRNFLIGDSTTRALQLTCKREKHFDK